jgi:hypothetical protein
VERKPSLGSPVQVLGLTDPPAPGPGAKHVSDEPSRKFSAQQSPWMLWERRGVLAVLSEFLTHGIAVAKQNGCFTPRSFG